VATPLPLPSRSEELTEVRTRLTETFDIRTIAIVGAGTMGRGIAQVAAQAGLAVLLYDLDTVTLEGALSSISRSMDRQIRGRETSEAEAGQALKRIRTVRDLQALEQADFLVEAVHEEPGIKTEVLNKADQVLRPGIVIASNTSSISITRLGASTLRPDRVIGMHFMNPVPVMVLVEVVAGLETSKETLEDTVELAEKLGKTPVVVSDSPGFISNRLLIPMINEAAYCVMEGIASPESIDKIMKLGMNHPMGPLALADLIGLDVCLQIMEVLHSGFGDSKYKPCPLIRRMVDAGRLGRKSGQGFYPYKPPL